MSRDALSRHELPNLQTIPPGELYITGVGQTRELRFSTSVLNTGRGPMYLIGELNDAGTDARALQLIRTHDGELQAHYVGQFRMDEKHGHWHLQDFAIFEIWSYGENGELQELLATSHKITFCLLDQTRIDPPPQHLADSPEFVECDWQSQGVSEGWMETYDASLPGQSLAIGDLPDGRYALRTQLDPSNRLHESNDGDNDSLAYVEIVGTSVTLLDGP